MLSRKRQERKMMMKTAKTLGIAGSCPQEMGRGLKKDEFIVREGGLDAARLSVNYIKSGGGGVIYCK